MPTHITWVTMHDPKVCYICKELEETAFTWEFADGEPIPDQLIHPKYGVVWDKASGSAAHEKHFKAPCRCHLKPDFDITDIRTFLHEWRVGLQEAKRRLTAPEGDYEE